MNQLTNSAESSDSAKAITKILVTGATGFLGRHICEQLVQSGYNVVALCRKEDSALQAMSVALCFGDVRDESALARAASGCSHVIHCAGYVSRDPKDAEALFEVHVRGTKAVLAAARTAGVRRVVCLSSSGVVAVSDDPEKVSTEADETPLHVLSRWPYYRAKVFAERAALEANAPGFEVLCLNPTLLLGPGDLAGSSTEDVRLFLEKRIPCVPGGGLSFVDVRDVAQTCVNALTSGQGGHRYLLASCNMTLREFFARLERVSGVRMPLLPLPQGRKWLGSGWLGQIAQIGNEAATRAGLSLGLDPLSLDMANYFWYVDATKAENDLGFRPRDPNSTLADTVSDLRERGIVWS
jgi:dihydroflavonol-4-reductase